MNSSTNSAAMRIETSMGRPLKGAYPMSSRLQPAGILAFGNEGNGLPDEFLECCDDVLTIPMRPDTESLNLSMAVGIVLYKAWEKNGFHV